MFAKREERERVSQKCPSLVVEREDGVLVDVVGGDDGECLEPRHLELLSDRHEGLARHLREEEVQGVSSACVPGFTDLRCSTAKLPRSKAT